MSDKSVVSVTGVLYLLYVDDVRTSQEAYYLSATEPNRLMLCGETVAVCCENRTEHTDTLCG
jgi:hypothetical protein